MNYNRHSLLPVILFSLAIHFFQASIAQPFEKGVSENLAKLRVNSLKDLVYHLEFNIPAKKGDKISCTESINLTLLKNDLPLLLDFKEQADKLISLKINSNEIPIDFQKEHLVISPKYLHIGSNTIHIKFIAGELSLNRNADYLYTLFVPDRARTVFPCFDQPDLKAVFNLELNLPADWEAISNAPVKKSETENRRKKIVFKSSDKISTYLFSFAAGKFKQARNKQKSMKLLYRETDTSKIKFSLSSIFRLHRDALKFMEAFTLIRFPFKKFDFIAIPDFQYGGMEHIGAIHYKADALFLERGATNDRK